MAKNSYGWATPNRPSSVARVPQRTQRASGGFVPPSRDEMAPYGTMNERFVDPGQGGFVPQRGGSAMMGDPSGGRGFMPPQRQQQMPQRGQAMADTLGGGSMAKERSVQGRAPRPMGGTSGVPSGTGSSAGGFVPPARGATGGFVPPARGTTGGVGAISNTGGFVPPARGAVTNTGQQGGRFVDPGAGGFVPQRQGASTMGMGGNYDAFNPQLNGMGGGLGYGMGGAGDDDDEPSEENDPPPYVPPTTPQETLNRLMSNQNYADVGWYGNEGNRNAAEGYSNYFLTPMMNAQLALQTQNYNEGADTRNFGEQQRMNTNQMDLANRGANREDQALQYGQSNNVRDYAEAVRQANMGNTLAQQQLAQLTNYQTGQLGNERTGLANQFTLGNRNADISQQQNRWNFQLGQGQNQNAQFANRTGRQEVANQFRLGQMTNATNRMGLGNQMTLGRLTDATNRRGQNNDMTLGRMSDASRRLEAGNQMQLGQMSDASRRLEAANALSLGNRADATNRMGLANQLSLGQAQNRTTQRGQTLDYQLGQGQNRNQANQIANQYNLGNRAENRQGRELNLMDRFRNRELSQNANLAREGFRNELQQSQMSAFGRVGAPNARALTSWY